MKEKPPRPQCGLSLQQLIEGEVQGTVFLSHGFGEHLGWYEGLAHRMAEIGLLVFGHDHQLSAYKLFKTLLRINR